jgi:hypothetical protein
MQVAQRGTSATGLGNGSGGYHTVDRVKFNEGASPTAEFTMSQDTDAPDGFQNSLKMACTTAESPVGADNVIRLEFKMEGQDLKQLAYGSSSAKSMTLSFWVKSSQTGVAAVHIYCADGTEQNTTNYTINSAGTWEYKTISIIGDTSNTFTNTNTESMRLEFMLMAGANLKSGSNNLNQWYNYNGANRALNQTVNVAASTSDYWQITGVQLEVGSVATPFEHRSYGEELALCQRYYTEFGNHTVFAGRAYGSADLLISAVCPVPLRASPTVGGNGDMSVYGASVNDAVAMSAVGVFQFTANTNKVALDINTYSGLTDNRVANTGITNSGTLTLDAEL